MTQTAYYKIKQFNIKISYNDKAITQVDFVKSLDEMKNSKTSILSELAYKQLCEYFDKKRQIFELPLELNGTSFQKKVWNALSEIPYAQTRSYKEIATFIGNKNASRAVGHANNKNPIAIIIPCHRVIGSSGKLVGYAGGLEIKKALLELESQSFKP